MISLLRLVHQTRTNDFPSLSALASTAARKVRTSNWTLAGSPRAKASTAYSAAVCRDAPCDSGDSSQRKCRITSTASHYSNAARTAASASAVFPPSGPPA